MKSMGILLQLVSVWCIGVGVAGGLPIEGSYEKILPPLTPGIKITVTLVISGDRFDITTLQMLNGKAETVTVKNKITSLGSDKYMVERMGMSIDAKQKVYGGDAKTIRRIVLAGDTLISQSGTRFSGSSKRIYGTWTKLGESADAGGKTRIDTTTQIISEGSMKTVFSSRPDDPIEYVIKIKADTLDAVIPKFKKSIKWQYEISNGNLTLIPLDQRELYLKK